MPSSDAIKAFMAAILFFAVALVVFYVRLPDAPTIESAPADHFSEASDIYDYGLLALLMMGVGSTFASFWLARTEGEAE